MYYEHDNEAKVRTDLHRLGTQLKLSELSACHIMYLSVQQEYLDLDHFLSSIAVSPAAKESYLHLTLRALIGGKRGVLFSWNDVLELRCDSGM